MGLPSAPPITFCHVTVSRKAAPQPWANRRPCFLHITYFLHIALRHPALLFQSDAIFQLNRQHNQTLERFWTSADPMRFDERGAAEFLGPVRWRQERLFQPRRHPISGGFVHADDLMWSAVC